MHQLQHSIFLWSHPAINQNLVSCQRKTVKSWFIILYLLFSISILWRRVWHHRTLPWVRQEKSSHVVYRGVAVTCDTWAGTWATATRSVWICCLDPEDETGLKWKSNRTPADVSPLVWMDHGVTLDTRAAWPPVTLGLDWEYSGRRSESLQSMVSSFTALKMLTNM